MQLVAYGAQDIYLTGNPQITFFKVVYRRHTNFAVEAIEQTFNGAVGKGKKFSCTISRNGDLLSRVYLECDSAAGTTFAGTTFAAEIEYAEIEIGGQCIDKHYGDWMDLWTDLTHNTDKSTMRKKLMVAGSKQFIPLQFWFCRNPGLALPLIALQYHEVKLNVQFDENAKTESACVFCDYIFLDTDERRRFAQVSHEYLIEQVQFSNSLNIKDTGGQVELRFNHPVKEIFWFEGDLDASGSKFSECLLQLNGHDRFRARHGRYFTEVQRYEHHSGSGDYDNIHMYSFALKPEEHQPSGTCNFSRIDNAVLNLTGTGADTSLKVYAMNYNVLRIMSGMGGLAYSN
jgi:hypothetical protein